MAAPRVVPGPSGTFRAPARASASPQPAAPPSPDRRAAPAPALSPATRRSLLVIGGTGRTGRRALEGLLQAGVPPQDICLLSSRPESSAHAELVARGLEVMGADLDSEGSLRAALGTPGGNHGAASGPRAVYVHALSADAGGGGGAVAAMHACRLLDCLLPESSACCCCREHLRLMCRRAGGIKCWRQRFRLLAAQPVQPPPIQPSWSGPAAWPPPWPLRVSRTSSTTAARAEAAAGASLRRVHAAWFCRHHRRYHACSSCRPV